MLYRRVGASGLQVSAITLGTAAIFKMDRATAATIFQAAFARGINQIDTAESYGSGESERVVGELLKSSGIERHKLVLSTKCLTYRWSDPDAGPNELRTLSRKYILHAIDRSLSRLGTDFVDIYYCHQYDPGTALAETVRCMSDVVQSGKARYWGTSNWSGEQIAAACAIADRYGLHKPICEQAEYSLLFRKHVEDDLAAACRQNGVGLAAWGPLAGGVLTGKYLSGVPEHSRAADPDRVASGISGRLIDEERNAIVRRLGTVAGDLGCDPAQLALGWCLAHPLIATVVTAASSLEQLAVNLGAVDVVGRLTPAILAEIGDIVGDYDGSYVPQELSNG